jgi:ribose transport system permease protein
MSEGTQTRLTGALLRRVDPPVAIAFGCIIAMLLLGSLYSRSFLSPEYLLQQLKVASFLGVIATGTMIVILLGQIDLSVPGVGPGRRSDGHSVRHRVWGRPWPP